RHVPRPGHRHPARRVAAVRSASGRRLREAVAVRPADPRARIHRLASRPATRAASRRPAPGITEFAMNPSPDIHHHPASSGPAPQPDRAHLTRSLMRFHHVLGFLVAYGMLLILLALQLTPERFEWLFAEWGPVELLSCSFWLLLAAACFTLPGLPRRPWQQGIVAVVAAAREADLHKAFTEMSVLKTSYYLKS